MSDTDSSSRSRFHTVLVDGVPFAVLRSDFPDGDAVRTRDQLEGKPQAYLADTPLHGSLDPRAANEAFTALGAKEGHGISRQAVDLAAHDALGPPPRLPRSAVSGRRPVVALLDTEVGFHPWIGADGADDLGNDAFWRDARHLPDGWVPTTDSGSALTAPAESGDPALTHSGHGTFIAGLIRQLAPDATVLSLPVMDSEGYADARLVHSALRWVLGRAKAADAGDAPGAATRENRSDLAIDVVNLSFGRYLEPDRVPSDVDATRRLIDELGDLGVRVVASAGNRGTTDVVLPAAWSGEDTDSHVALKAVGALDPNGHPAPYSNHGDWVSTGARGTALLSCLPRFTSATWPDPALENVKDLALHEDPNLQQSTFARWAGTSFAAAIVTGTVAARLGAPGGGDLAPTDRESMNRRARDTWQGFTPMPGPPATSGIDPA